LNAKSPNANKASRALEGMLIRRFRYEGSCAVNGGWRRRRDSNFLDLTFLVSAFFRCFYRDIDTGGCPPLAVSDRKMPC
jgi:hypothetical protein